jgi:hypothetical protein
VECFELALECWDSNYGNMTWPGFAKSNQAAPQEGDDQEDEGRPKLVPIGTAKRLRALADALQAEGLSFRQSRNRIEILDARWSDPRLQRALAAADWKPPRGAGPDWVPPDTLLDDSTSSTFIVDTG